MKLKGMKQINIKKESQITNMIDYMERIANE